MIKLKIIKILTKKQRKQIKNKKGANWNKYYYYWKKNYKFDLKNKIKNYYYYYYWNNKNHKLVKIKNH